METVYATSKELRGLIPDHQHIANDQVYLKGKCKQELLDKVDRTALGVAAVVLHRTLVQFGTDYTAMGNEGKPDSDYEQLVECGSIFKAAKQAISVIAHVHVIQGLKGTQQLDEAIKVDASKPQGIPKPLVDALASLVAQHADAKAKQHPSKKRKV